MKALELTMYPKLERPKRGEDIMAYRSQFIDEMLIIRQKRLTNAELAAEWQYQDNRCGQKCEGYGVAHDGTSMGSEEDEIEILRIVHRFAILPHYDEEPTK